MLRKNLLAALALLIAGTFCVGEADAYTTIWGYVENQAGVPLQYVPVRAVDLLGIGMVSDETDEYGHFSLDVSHFFYNAPFVRDIRVLVGPLSKIYTVEVFDIFDTGIWVMTYYKGPYLPNNPPGN